MRPDSIDRYEPLVDSGYALLKKIGTEKNLTLVPEYLAWIEAVKDWIQEVAPNSGLSAQWISLGMSNTFESGHRDNGLVSRLTFSRLVSERISWLSKIASIIPRGGTPPGKPVTRVSQRVFVVHGSNNAMREAVARYLTKLDLEPIILHEQPDKGKTVIEKFFEYSDVSFAVIILSGDDRGGTRNGKNESQQPRGRQNVIFELGFFLGSLGRERVRVLYEEGVEMPSDYEGVIYIKIDSEGAWQLRLAREMKAVGVPFDMNKAV